MLDISSGKRENRGIGDIAGLCWDSEEDDDSDFEDVESEIPGISTDEVHDILGIASDCVGNLFRISMLVRKATPRDRFVKALQGRRERFIDQFDINYVQERYPRLENPEKRWLLERLGRAITNRRQYLRYCREHKERLEQPQPDAEKSPAAIEATPALAGKLVMGLMESPNTISNDPDPNRGELDHPAEYPSQTPPGIVPQSVQTRPSTKASTLDKTRLKAVMKQPDNLDIEDEDEDGRTYSSAASSVALEEGAVHVHLPTLIDVSQGNREFECIFCRGIKRFTREKTWRRHAYRDLKAYVCTLGEGECGLELFGDQKTWFDHELQKHRRTWTCVICKSGPLRSLSTFQSHVTTRHRELGEAQASVLASVSQSTIRAIPADDCPFCDEWGEKLKQTVSQTALPSPGSSSHVVVTVEPHQFRRHVGTHLQQLALFAIPRALHHAHDKEDTEEAGSNALDLGASNASRRMSSGELSFRSNNMMDEADPPLNDNDPSTLLNTLEHSQHDPHAEQQGLKIDDSPKRNCKSPTHNRCGFFFFLHRSHFRMIDVSPIQ